MENLALGLFLLRPELCLALGAMLLLIFGVLQKHTNPTRVVTWASVGIYAVAAFFTLQMPGDKILAFNDLFVSDAFANYLKLLVFAASAAASLMALAFFEAQKNSRFEYPIVIMLASLGMCLMVSANDLIALYMGLELQSLSLYVLAAFQRDERKSSEAGLKYFVLGALSSGLLLYGASLVYGFTGSTNFSVINTALMNQELGLGLLFGLVMIIAGLAFKISAVPFHMWTPDVYEGAPTPVTAFFAAAPKVAAMGLLARVMFDAFSLAQKDWQQLIVFMSIASMALGAVAAIGQNNIKRLLAFSSIGHVGYALIGLAAGSLNGIRGLLVYLALYVAMTIGSFLCVLAMKRRGYHLENINDLSGLARTQPALAACLAILMFSLAGIPLLAGFFGKLYIFLAAVEAQLWALAIIGVITSVIGCYYYLRIIKIMYFDDAAPAFDAIDAPAQRALLWTSAALCSPLSFAYIAPLLSAATVAAKSLLG
jgi:NADH-quinone oxidoreductase subunit N